MACTFKRIKTWQLCHADLKNKCKVIERNIAPNHPDAVIGQYNSLKELFSFFAALETRKGVTNSSGLALEDNVTHKIYARYRDLQSFVFDAKKHKIAIKNKLYTIASIENLNDANVTFIFNCVQDGDTTNWGSHS